jgi:hypothetical protein
MRGIIGLVIAVAVILLAMTGFVVARYGTADPCRATARLVQKDCTSFFSDQSCDDLKTMDEDRLTGIIRQRKGVFRCLIDLSRIKPEEH